MKLFNANLTQWVAALTVATVGAAPMAASAQSHREMQHRQNQKNTWRNLGIAGGVVGVYGLLKGDRTLAIAGLAGGAYSAYRYEQDRKSQSHMERERARMFSQRTIIRNGHRYERRTWTKHGHRYYSFVRVR